MGGEGVYLFCLEEKYVAKVKKQMKLSQQFCPKLYQQCNGAFSLTWPESMQIYWNKRKRLHPGGGTPHMDGWGCSSSHLGV